MKRSIDRLLDALEADGDLVAVHDRLRRRQDEKARLEAEMARVSLAERDARPMKVSREAIRAVVRRMKEALDSGEPEVVRAVLQGLVQACGRLQRQSAGGLLGSIRAFFGLHARFAGYAMGGLEGIRTPGLQRDRLAC